MGRIADGKHYRSGMARPIFLKLGDWGGWFSAYSANRKASSYRLGALFHELLHKNIVGGGFTHDQMNGTLTAIGAQSQIVGQNFTSDNVSQICF